MTSARSKTITNLGTLTTNCQMYNCPPIEPMHDGSLICPVCYPQVEVYGEILPGYVLVRAVTDFQSNPRLEGVYLGRHENFRANTVAITNNYHDLDYILPVAPIPSPFDWTKDWEIAYDNLPMDDPIWMADVEFEDCADNCEHIFEGDPIAGHHLVEACHAAGYIHEFDGSFVSWLIDRIARRIASGPRASALQLELPLEW